MSETSWWFGGGTWHDRRQNEAIGYIENSLYAQASRTSRQLNAARKYSQRVANDLAGLSKRVDEFIEYTDLRFELQKFADVADVRSGIERRFQSLAQGVPAGGARFQDVAGYWMPPAAEAALTGLETNGTPIGSSELDTARMRDRIRTEVFLLSVGTGYERDAISRAAAEAMLRLPMALADPEATDTADTEVAEAWDRLWTRTAEGEFGPGAVDALRAKLQPLVSVSAERWYDTAKKHWSKPDVALNNLRTRFETALNAVPDPARLTDIDQWRDFLQELVSEGFGPERPVLARIAQIRAGIADGFDPRPTWQQPAGTLDELIVRDVLDQHEMTGRRRLAIELNADDLVNAADRLREEAVRPAKRSETVSVAGTRVPVDLNGADMNLIEARLGAHYAQPSPFSIYLLWTLAGLALVGAVVTGVIAQGGPAFLLSIAMIGLAIAGFRGHRHRRERAEELSHARGRAQTQVRRIQDQLVTKDREARKTAASAEADHAVLVKLLAPYCGRQPG